MLQQDSIYFLCGMDFIPPFILNYAEQHTTGEPELLLQLNRRTHTGMLKPRMLSGHLQGRFLSMISCLMHPIRVLDIGTYTGYSAICLSEGLDPNGVLYTLDNDDEALAFATPYIQACPRAADIRIIHGKAADSIVRIQQEVDCWDLVWLDADKENYSLYYELCIEKLRPGGLIMADNVLWSGKVLDTGALENDRDTAALDAFNKKVKNDRRVETVLLPVRDGIMMIRKR